MGGSISCDSQVIHAASGKPATGFEWTGDIAASALLRALARRSETMEGRGKQLVRDPDVLRGCCRCMSGNPLASLEGRRHADRRAQ